VCVSGDGKSLRLRNASLLHDGRRTQAKVDDVTRSCALGSRRVEESSKACSSTSARAIFTHTWTSVSIYCLAHSSGYPCNRACSARASRLPMFSRRESEGKNHLRSFRWIFNMLYHILLPIIYGKSTFVIVNNLQKIIV